jgi:hypothetical protein
LAKLLTGGGKVTSWPDCTSPRRSCICFYYRDGVMRRMLPAGQATEVFVAK